VPRAQLQSHRTHREPAIFTGLEVAPSLEQLARKDRRVVKQQRPSGIEP